VWTVEDPLWLRASTLNLAAKGSGRGAKEHSAFEMHPYEADQSGIVVDEDSSVALHHPLIIKSTLTGMDTSPYRFEILI
jgi:hypothetical protein